MHIVVYGIPNCDQVKKARNWFSTQAVEYRFHDFRKDGLNREMLDRWLTHVPWDALLNRRGTTWRQLPKEQQQSLTDAQAAKDLMLQHPTLIKRPVIEHDNDLLIGFNPDILAQRCGK